MLAERLAGRGHAVGALDLLSDEPARARLSAAGDVAFAECDVRDGDAVAAAVASLGAPRLVVHCAGVIDARRFTDLGQAAFRRVVDVNLVGSRNVAHAVWPALADGGHLVLVASLAGLVGTYAYWLTDRTVARQGGT